MRSLFVITFLLVSAGVVIAQDVADSVEVQRSFGPVFKQNGRRLKPRDLLELTRSNPEAFNEMRIAKSNYDASQVFGCIGGFLVGWPLGTALGGGKPNWTLAAIGGGVILVSLPFSSGFSKHAMKAMSIYNSDLKRTARHPVRMKAGFSVTGVRLEMKF